LTQQSCSPRRCLDQCLVGLGVANLRGRELLPDLRRASLWRAKRNWSASGLEVPAFGGQGISSKATVCEKIFSSFTSKQPGPATWRRSKRGHGEGGWRWLDKGTGELGDFAEPNPGVQQGRVKTRPSSKRLQYRPGCRARFRKLRTLGTCCLGVAGVSGGRLRLCEDNWFFLMAVSKEAHRCNLEMMRLAGCDRVIRSRVPLAAVGWLTAEKRRRRRRSRWSCDDRR
jgi:hypothetical protein